jgi:hypothetical protein
MKGIFIIEKLGEPIEVPSQKAENGKLTKRLVVLRDMGERYGDCIVASVLGDMAKDEMLKEEDVVISSIRLSVHEHNGQTYQDAVVNAISILCAAE